MDISSSTASTTTSSSATATAENTQTASAQKSQQSDKSFKDELQKASNDTNEVKAQEKTAETNADKITDNKSDNKTDNKTSNKSNNNYNAFDQNLLLSGEINMAVLGNQNFMQINNMLNSETNNLQQLVENNIRQASVTAVLTDDSAPTKVDYSIMQMSSDDAQFFADLVQNTDKTLQNVAADLQSGIEQNVQQANKNVNVSATLLNALAETVKTNQPFRIDFDKDVSVIIKVDKDGALSAKFIPGDRAVEEYLKQNISTLRQRFDEQELPYSDLSYSRQKQQQGNNRRNNKENDHE